MDFETIRYDTGDAIASITLNRPQHLNAIVPLMPDEIERAVERACRDSAVRVIVLKGEGRAFCAGFDFSTDVQNVMETALSTDGEQGVPEAVAQRDGPFADYSQAPPSRKPARPKGA